MSEKITISIPAYSTNKEILATLNDNFVLVERRPLGPQASLLTEIMHHCFVEISNGMLNSIGDYIFTGLLLPILLKDIDKPQIIQGGSIVETEVTKYLNRMALLAICPVYKEYLQREVSTKFYFLLDSTWSVEDLEFGVLLFKAEMQKFISRNPSKIDPIVSHRLVDQHVVLTFDKNTGEFVYLGPIPQHILDRHL